MTVASPKDEQKEIPRDDRREIRTTSKRKSRGMTAVHAVVAVKGFERGKYRLAGVLTEAERHLLIETMLNNVLDALRAASGIASINVLSNDGVVLPEDVERIVDPGAGLNAAVAHAARVLSSEGAHSMLFLPADLPFVTVDDINALLAAAHDHEAVVAPDARHSGTNALLLAPPQLIQPQFGEHSFAAHVQAIRCSAARSLHIVERPALAHDIDVPADLRALTGGGLRSRYQFVDAALRKAS
jgi:2-phospho-L-lactate/phosphoenolpyruvate guanylyltransferase